MRHLSLMQWLLGVGIVCFVLLSFDPRYCYLVIGLLLMAIGWQAK